MENKKKYGIIAVVCLLLLLVIGGTYAYWTTTKIQEDENIIGTTCLSLTFTSVTEGIELSNTYPISDSEGMSTPGYTFRLTNNCTGYIDYTVNLESLTEIAAANRIDSQYINAVLDSNAVQTISSYDNGVQVLPAADAYEAKALTSGTLAPNGQNGSTVTYVLRTWLDKNAPTTMMNKSWKGKITISAGNAQAPAPQNPLATTYVSNLAATDDSIIDDGTADHNLRYIGANPDNYVTFNNELWRIVGVMNNVEGSSTDTGSGETRIKLAKATFLDAPSEWSSEAAEIVSNSYNNEYTVVRLGQINQNNNAIQTANYNYNNWEHATLNVYLNSTYYNSISDTNLIDTSTYYLGGYYSTGNSSYDENNMTPSEWYIAERNTTNVYTTNPGSVTNYIALMYPSDYGFATNGGVTATPATSLTENSIYNETNTNICMNTALYNWKGANRFCPLSDWLFDKEEFQWALTPSASIGADASSVSSEGNVNSTDYGRSVIGYYWRVRPVLYLKSNVKIIADETHDGTSVHPYGLQI